MTVLKILYQDEDLVVVSKPEKMLTHRTEIANGDTEFALQLLRDQIGRRVSPVYRLDRGTSGILMFGLNREIVSALSRKLMRPFTSVITRSSAAGHQRILRFAMR